MAWQEPLLRCPVLILESDDWGPGPLADARALEQLAETLARHRDEHGRCAVMTLGLLLAVPDTKRIRDAGGRQYHPARLSAPQFAPIMAAIRKGVAAGVFSPQLHGMEHYWPQAVMRAARERPEINDWLLQEGGPRSESLPPALQSRWIDGSELPGRSLPEDEVVQAATSEVRLFRELFGVENAVAVPPTFIWSEVTEAAWVAHGVSVVVTPGVRYCGRDANGKLVSAGRRLYNGQTSATGVTYLVRDRYFEPTRGHRAAGALAALEEKARLRRPALLETHRFNFTGTPPQSADALHELDTFLRLALERFAGLRFMSTAELAQAIRVRDEELIETRAIPRLGGWLGRTVGAGAS